MHREHWVEEMRESDAMRLGHEPESRAVAVEAPRPALLNDVETGFIVAVEQLVGYLAGWRLVGQLQRLGAEPLHVHHRDEGVRQHPTNGGIGLQILEPAHRSAPALSKVAADQLPDASCRLRSTTDSGYALQRPPGTMQH